MIFLNFKILSPCDSYKLERLLVDNPIDYSKYFHPFNFNALSLKEILDKSKKDKFIGIELSNLSNSQTQLIAFYMLRGLDEGYTDPMYGVFVHHLYCSIGVGRLTLHHAESLCKLNGYMRLLLKVYPENTRAYQLYKRLGFLPLREEATGQLLLYKDLSQNMTKKYEGL